MVDEVCDERASGGAWFVYLKTGFQYDGAHCFGEDRVKDIHTTLKRVAPCGCDDCKAGNIWGTEHGRR